MSYVVTMHTCGGSMGEAIWYQESVTVATAEEAAEVEKQFYALPVVKDNMMYGNELVVQTIPVGDLLTVDESIAKFKAHGYLEEEEEGD